MRLAAAFGRGVLEFLWPGRCPVCLRWLCSGDPQLIHGTDWDRPALLHRECLDGLERAVSPNRFCFPGDAESSPVHFLWRDDPAFFRILHPIKYGGRRPLLEPLVEEFGAWARAELADAEGVWVLPIPDDPRRLRERGYSINAELATGVARACSLPCLPGALVRRRAAPALAKLEGAVERRRVLNGVFGMGRLAELPLGCPVLLVDDQVTTGATLEACLPLLRARRHRVVALALAGAALAPNEVQT